MAVIARDDNFTRQRSRGSLLVGSTSLDDNSNDRIPVCELHFKLLTRGLLTNDDITFLLQGI